MFELNKIYCEDCMVTMDRMIKENIKVNNIITSPPYNTVTKGTHLLSDSARKDFVGRYDVFNESMTNEEYLKWTSKLFDYYDKILTENGVIIYVLSYGNSNHELMYRVLYQILEHTQFTIADNIIWKKGRVIPNVSTSNKLTRRCEYVFILCRKEEYLTFKSNKKVTAIRKDGRKYYNSIQNFIHTYNNDFSKKRFMLNGATFSTELITKIIDIYVPDEEKKDWIIYDSFMGSGTTANACKIKGIKYIGSEISQAQVDFANERIKETQTQLI